MKKVQQLGWLVLLFSSNGLFAQDVWDLRRCVEFAKANNITVLQNNVQADISDLTFKQSRDARWPSLNFQGSAGEQYGRSIDPTSNQFTNNQITFVNGSFQTSVTLFNWFTQKNTIDANRLTLASNKLQSEVLINDLSLNIASAYLQALLSHEQIRIAKVQVAQTKEQLEITNKRVEAGALPELNKAELEAQLARDSATLVTAQSTFATNELQIKSLLNLDAAAPFQLAIPEANAIPVYPIIDLQPGDVFSKAINDQPRQKVNQLQLEIAQKNIAIAKAAMYPTITAFGSLQSAYSSALQFLPKGNNISSVAPTSAFVTVTGNNYFVNQPFTRAERFVTANVFRQFDYNFRQSIGLGLNVPIFSGHQAKTQWRRAQLNEKTQVLQMKADTLKLKQDIYQAYQSAVNTLQTFNSRKKAVETTQYAFSLGQKRYDVGLLPILDLITLQNNLQRARIDLAAAQYEYIFRLKILEFYKYNSINL